MLAPTMSPATRNPDFFTAKSNEIRYGHHDGLEDIPKNHELFIEFLTKETWVQKADVAASNGILKASRRRAADRVDPVDAQPTTSKRY
ncbi:hypothetical protein WR25_23749 [Diploscapter pachys]|uniref:Uncharacterized protein n=1 Tax=Diploscapter pachys TaxID=2018661 RepID=A0A2A2JFB3_9BILA|nr:hypothetical protein WR25_23749 [Diploscapter pachys]